MGTLKSGDGGWCSLLLKILFSAACPCLSSIIILHNSLIDCRFTTERGCTRPWTEHSCLNECAFSTFWLLWRHKNMPLSFTGSNLDLNISVLTMTHSSVMPTPLRFAVRIALVTAERGKAGLSCFRQWCPPEDLHSFLLLWKPFAHYGHRRASLVHWVHQHTITTDARIPFQLHFCSEAERSCDAYYTGWDKFSWNGRRDGKGPPFIPIWA